MTKRSFFRLIKNKYTIIGLIILVIIVIYALAHRSAGPTFESASVAVGNVVEKVSVTGSISPLSKADLAFKKSGVVSAIPVKVGDKVKKGDLIASIGNAGDLAALQSAQATLADMARNLTPQELSVQQAALDTAKQNALNALHDGYVKAQSAFVNYLDTFFNNPQSANPTINVTTGSPAIQSNINTERYGVTSAFKKWSDLLGSATSDNAAASVAAAQGYLSTMKLFGTDLTAIVQALNPGNSGMSQSAVDGNLATLNAGLSALASAIDTVTSAGSSLSSTQSAYDLKLAGNSEQSIAAQQAKVSQAQAALSDDSIFSPIDGVITKADPNVGEFVSAGQSGFAVQSDGGYKIEAYVPEADIAKIALKNKADITLDAYGPYVVFAATVIDIDPAETVLEGVPTYKVTMAFDAPDARIRSGMTANTEVLTHESDNVLNVPTRAIIDDNGKKTIRIVSDDGKTFSTTSVAVGLKGSDGTTEIVSGVSEGEKVVTYVK
jgi:HlyD family secretion protein